MFTAEIIGAVELSKALRAIDADLQKQFHRDLTGSARRRLVPAVRAAAPKGRTGALRRTVRVSYSQSKGLRLLIGRRGRGDYRNAFYASWVIYGAPGGQYRNARTDTGRARVGKRRGRQRPNRFVYRVLDQLWPLVVRDVQAAIDHHMAVFEREINRYGETGRAA